jgi:hypothetical protein
MKLKQKVLIPRKEDAMEPALYPAVGLIISGPNDAERTNLSFCRQAKHLLVYKGENVNVQDKPLIDCPISSGEYHALKQQHNPTFVCLLGSPDKRRPKLTDCRQIAWCYYKPSDEAPVSSCFVLGSTKNGYGIATLSDSNGKSYFVTGIGSTDALRLD